jgi:hypothetical protein
MVGGCEFGSRRGALRVKSRGRARESVGGGDEPDRERRAGRGGVDAFAERSRDGGWLGPTLLFLWT